MGKDQSLLDAPVWRNRPGLAGFLDRPLERWLTKSSSPPTDFFKDFEGLAISARPIDFGRGHLHTDELGDVHLVTDEFHEREPEFTKNADIPANYTSWVRFDPCGRVLSRFAIPGEGSREHLVIDAAGRLWLDMTLSRSPNRHGLVRVDPTGPSAVVVAESDDYSAFEGFSIDTEGEPSLRKGAPSGGGASVPVFVYDPPTKRWARVAIVGVALTQAASAIMSLFVGASWLEAARAGESAIVDGSYGQRAEIQGAEVLQTAVGFFTQSTASAITAIGVLLLWPMIRDTPSRAMSIGALWILVTGLLAIVAYAIAFLHPLGVAAMFAKSPASAFIHGACLIACGSLRNRMFTQVPKLMKRAEKA